MLNHSWFIYSITFKDDLFPVPSGFHHQHVTADNRTTPNTSLPTNLQKVHQQTKSHHPFDYNLVVRHRRSCLSVRTKSKSCSHRQSEMFYRLLHVLRILSDNCRFRHTSGMCICAQCMHIQTLAAEGELAKGFAASEVSGCEYEGSENHPGNSAQRFSLLDDVHRHHWCQSVILLLFLISDFRWKSCE